VERRQLPVLQGEPAPAPPSEANQPPTDYEPSGGEPPPQGTYQPDHQQAPQRPYQPGYEQAPPPQGNYRPDYGQPSQPAYQPGYGQPSQPAYQPGYGQPPQPAYQPGYGQPSAEQPQSLTPPNRQDWRGEPGPPAAPDPNYGAPAENAVPAYGRQPVAAGSMPADLWRGVDAGAMQALLKQTPLPSQSPTLAQLVASALAAGRPYDEREMALRTDALKRAGRVEEAATLLGVSVDTLAGGGEGGDASPVALFFLAQDENEEPQVRLAAAERAAALNVIGGEALARAYREVAPKLAKGEKSPAALRARLFASLDAQGSAATRAESIDALLASGKDAGIEAAMAEALSPASADLARSPEAGRFAETGIRVAALAGEDQAAWAWVDSGGEPVQGFALLLGAADPDGTRAREALAEGVAIAQTSHLPGPVLQRLVTVLDALGEEVPIPLWDLASRSPEPQDGYLPPTGVLSALKEAADRGEGGRVILLAATALGPKGPKDAQHRALGDALRALRHAGFEAEARRLALEALIAHWPARGKG
jgi:hypothetical protein